MNENVLILYSGGADSRLMLEFSERMKLKPYCVLIDYGQLHKQELGFAKDLLALKNIQCQTVSIKDLNVNSGLTGDGVKNNTGNVHEMYVPGRNTIFISIAFSIAEYRDIPIIWHGADYSDFDHLFPDCYQSYFGKMNELLNVAGPKKIRVEAPLLGLTKENIITLLDSFGIDKKEYFSGYGNL